ncbi:MAG: hypothetical protein QOE23_1519 [Pseudonocardiales bacterium]|jgi:type IV pilus assembly protein PilO|nr:hypothetical protein [Pseudonocardiales bacterium]
MSGLKGDRVWMVGGAVAGVVVSALAWFMVINPELSNAASLDEQTADSQTQNISLQSKLHRLQADNANMDVLVASLRETRTALPVTSDLAEFTRQLSGYASANRVSLSGITAGEPAAMTSAAPAAATTSGTAGTAATAGTGAPAARTAPAAVGQLYGLPLTVVVKGSPAGDLGFLAAVQGPGRRAALVSGTQLTADNTKRGGAVQLTIQLQVFVSPQPPGAVDELLDRLADPTK